MGHEGVEPVALFVRSLRGGKPPLNILPQARGTSLFPRTPLGSTLKFVGHEGVEPSTLSLRGTCSTN